VQCCDEWLSTGLAGKSRKTISRYGEALAPVLAVIGGKALAKLTVRDVETALQAIAGTRSTRTVEIAALSLQRAVQRAPAHADERTLCHQGDWRCTRRTPI
jgi:hypothetical protein